MKIKSLHYKHSKIKRMLVGWHTAASCAILFEMSDVLEYRITGLLFKAKNKAAMPSTTRSQKCCKCDRSTTAGIMYMWLDAIFKVK